MVLFDSRSRQPGDADAITAHLEWFGFAVLVEKTGVHGRAVFGAQHENMTDLDPTLDRQRAFAVRREIAFLHVANISDGVRLRQITPPVDAGNVEVGFIGTAYPVAHDRHFTINHHTHWFFHVDKPQITGLASKIFIDLGQRGETQTALEAAHPAQLDFVHVMVAAQHQQPDPGLDGSVLLVFFFRSHHQGLDGLPQGYLQVVGHVRAGAFAGRGSPGHRLLRRLAATLRRQRLGLFHIRRIVAVGAIDDGILAGRRNHLEFLAHVSANGAAVCGHGPVTQAKAVEYRAIGFGHGLVTALGTVQITVKAVRVLHDEFAPAHQAKTRTALIAEFGLDLVEIFR